MVCDTAPSKERLAPGVHSSSPQALRNRALGSRAAYKSLRSQTRRAYPFRPATTPASQKAGTNYSLLTAAMCTKANPHGTSPKLGLPIAFGQAQNQIIPASRSARSSNLWQGIGSQRGPQFSQSRYCLNDQFDQPVRLTTNCWQFC